MGHRRWGSMCTSMWTGGLFMGTAKKTAMSRAASFTCAGMCTSGTGMCTGGTGMCTGGAPHVHRTL
eukprot:1161824-Pelagomonas_calceolata.AAC.10